MKYYKVTVPCGYEVYKYFQGVDETTVKDIALADLNENFSSWYDDGAEFMNFYSKALIEEIAKDEFDDYSDIEGDNEYQEVNDY